MNSLKYLFGSKHTEYILFFVHAKGKCYASQVASRLNVALHGVQYTLDNLEKGGLLTSERIGRTKLYTYNTEYPLSKEFNALIKRAYLNLSEEDQKFYKTIPKKPKKTPKNKSGIMSTAKGLWNQLQDFKKILDKL